MFQSKVFRRLFYSYILIIAVSMTIYAAFLLFQSRQIAQRQTMQENELILRGVEDIVEDRVEAAQDVVRELCYSTAMRDLYMSARLRSTLDTYSDYAVQTQLRSVLAAHGGLLYGITVFIDGSDRAYSAGGPVFLTDPFDMPDNATPFIKGGSISEIFGFKDNKRYYFEKEGLFYCDSYTWQTGTEVGICCVFIDAQEIERALEKVLTDVHGVRVLYGNEKLFAVGDDSGTPVLTQISQSNPSLSYELYGSSPILFGFSFVLFGALFVLALIAALLVWLAFRQSKRYYQPISTMGSMVSATDAAEASSAAQADEMDGIIRGIQSLIGEKNRYHEKMLTIGPYAGTGMLEAIVAGGEGGERLSILTDEDFLDLRHPYYVVTVVNFAHEERRYTDNEQRELLEESFRQLSKTWSTEERHIAWYFRDAGNVYLIVSDDAPELSDELFFGLHRQISAMVADRHLLVSMGVDRVREEIGELGAACESAMNALGGLLHDGRGEVFFAEEQASMRVDYYFPAGFCEQLRGCLERRDRQGVHNLLFDIYKKNLDLDAPAEVYRALLDEFYPTMMKATKEATGLVTVHLNIRRTQGLMTLQEVFDYYDAALMSVIDLLIENEDVKDEEGRLDEEILSYVDAHFCDQDISLQLLSDRFHVSNKYLLLLFKQRYGTTYLQYLQNKRIARALQMLREGTRSLSEIGEMVGYPNQLTFRRNFKAVMGVNPSEYKG